jgi:hypothetical protein
MEQQRTKNYFHLYFARWLEEYPCEEDRKAKGDRENTSYFDAKEKRNAKEEEFSTAIELNGTGWAMSDGALCSWEFRYSSDKEPATKNWLLVSLHVPNPQGGAAIIWIGGTSNHNHVKLRNLTRVALGISGLKLRQYTTVSFVNRERPEIYINM